MADMTLQQVQQNPVLNSLLAPYLQPGAQYGLTQQETATSGQSASTSAQEQQNLQAQNPGIQAQSTTEQVQALQKQAQLKLSSDLKNKMTLGSAISKYTSLGLHPDDVFRQYLSESPWGLPHESPTQLTNMGVTAGALGKIGEPSSFMDRWNTRNAVQSVRDAQDKWGKTNMGGRLAGIIGLDPNTEAYKTAHTIVGNHLSTLIPGAPGAQATAQSLVSLLPDPNNPTSGAPGVADAKFKSLEDQLLKTKGYSYKDLGISGPTGKSTKSGGDLLHMLLPAAGATLGGFAGAAVPGADLSGVPEVAGMAAGGAGGQWLSDVLEGKKPGADVAATGVMSGAFGAGGRMVGGALGGILGAGGKDIADMGAGLPKSPLMDFINPSRAISKVGQFRDAVVQKAETNGKTIDGDKIVADLEESVPKLKGGNLGQGKSIDTALADAKDVFAGKTFTPSQLDAMYKEADSGFTRTGIAKTPIQANIDRSIRDIASKHLDDATSGQFTQATKAMAKSYQTQKSPVRAGVKNVAKYSLPLGLAGAGGNTLVHLLFGN